MDITLVRSYQPNVTEGIIYDDQNNQICFSLELPNLDNKQEVSCIPEGKYNFQKFFSQHLGWVYRLQNVPDRSLIDIHSGNDVNDLRGCICVGTEQGTLNGLPAVLNSKVALQKLFDIVGSSGTINITGA
jgi:hypothetical protein